MLPHFPCAMPETEPRDLAADVWRWVWLWLHRDEKECLVKKKSSIVGTWGGYRKQKAHRHMSLVSSRWDPEVWLRTVNISGTQHGSDPLQSNYCTLSCQAWCCREQSICHWWRRLPRLHPTQPTSSKRALKKWSQLRGSWGGKSWGNTSRSEAAWVEHWVRFPSS